MALLGVVAAILSRSAVPLFPFTPLLLFVPNSTRVDGQRWPRVGRARRQSWDDVVGVLAPDRWTQQVAMRMRDGSEAPTPIPGDWAERVAQIGGVPVEQRQRGPRQGGRTGDR